jgi:hypothetical protein
VNQSEPETAPSPPQLPDAVRRLALLLASEPAAELLCELPRPPGINDWWEPITVRRRGKAVASMRLTAVARKYKAHAEDELRRQGIDVVALEDEFRDLWLQIHVTSYIATPMERDVDGPLKPIQDLLCQLLGVNDGRVRYTSGALLLDPARPRISIRIEGYQVWDADGMGGPFYMVSAGDATSGRRTLPQLVTARRVPTPRPRLRAVLDADEMSITAGQVV